MPGGCTLCMRPNNRRRSTCRPGRPGEAVGVGPAGGRVARAGDRERLTPAVRAAPRKSRRVSPPSGRSRRTTRRGYNSRADAVSVRDALNDPVGQVGTWGPVMIGRPSSGHGQPAIARSSQRPGRDVERESARCARVGETRVARVSSRGRRGRTRWPPNNRGWSAAASGRSNPGAGVWPTRLAIRSRSIGLDDRNIEYGLAPPFQLSLASFDAGS